MKETIIKKVSLLISSIIRQIKTKKSANAQLIEKYILTEKYQLTDLELQELSEYLPWLNNLAINQ